MRKEVLAIFKSGIFKLGMMVTSLALLLGVSSAGVTCAAWFHQPKVPQGMERFMNR